MPFRNVDESPEVLESGDAHLYSRILVINTEERQRGYSELRVNPQTTARYILHLKGSLNVASLMSASILFFTVISSLVVGVLAGYAVVTGILFALAPRSEAPSVAGLVPSQTHASGD